MSTRNTLCSIALLTALATGPLTACGGDAPSASEWAADIVPICQRLETDRQAAAAALPTDSAPSVEQLMAFLADFTPTFQKAAAEIKAVERPEGLDGEIVEFEAALDGVIASWQNAATDPAVARPNWMLTDKLPKRSASRNPALRSGWTPATADPVRYRQKPERASCR